MNEPKPLNSRQQLDGLITLFKYRRKSYKILARKTMDLISNHLSVQLGMKSMNKSKTERKALSKPHDLFHKQTSL